MGKKFKYIPQEVSSPGTSLLDVLEESGISQSELAERMGRPTKTINEIIKGKAIITPETAIQLETVLKIPAKFWMKREQQYQEYKARLQQCKALENSKEWLKDLPVKDMQEFKWIEGSNNKTILVSQCLSYFGVASCEQWDKIWMQKGEKSVAFRISLAGVPNPKSVATWLRHGEIEAQNMDIGEFNEDHLKAQLHYLRTIAYEAPNNFREIVKKSCKEVGVKFILTRSVKNARISGASRWLYGNPMVQISDRYKAYDHFWFTFFHEIGHIILHGKKDIFLEDHKLNKDGFNDPEKEKEANEFASNLLIPKKAFKEFLENTLKITKNSILEFSENIKMHPSIIVGRLRHEKLLRHDQFSDLLKCFEIEYGD